MYKTFFIAVIYLFNEVNKTCQVTTDDKDFFFNSNDESESNNQNKGLQELQNEELIIAEALSLRDFYEGSGDSEGSGDFVEHSLDITNCIENGYDTVCSNKGVCTNNKCVCMSQQFEIDNNSVMYRHSGRYCEECPYCRAQRCHEFLPCIECHSFLKSGSCDSFCKFDYKIVNHVVRNIDNDEKYCDVESTSGCYFKFKYFYDAQNTVVVQYERDFVCFNNGLKIIIFTFLGVVIYIFAVTGLVARKCCLSKELTPVKSRTSLSTRHDLLRQTQFN